MTSLCSPPSPEAPGRLHGVPGPPVHADRPPLLSATSGPGIAPNTLARPSASPVEAPGGGPWVPEEEGRHSRDRTSVRVEMKIPAWFADCWQTDGLPRSQSPGRAGTEVGGEGVPCPEVSSSVFFYIFWPRGMWDLTSLTRH